ncbi:MAG: ACP S-malonyltransferase [Capsulimonadaceae bacterium]
MKKIAFLFPGQGSQTPGMGKALYEQGPAARNIFDRADAILAELAPQKRTSLSRISFDGPEEDLRQTVNAQPALYTCSAAALAALADAGVVEPGTASVSVVAGHSVGEYATLLAAGAFDFETGLRLVVRRAQEMQAAAVAIPGTMAALLGLDAEAVSRICSEVSESGGVVDAANFNAAGQVVISGQVAAVEAASALARQRGAKRVIPLSVSGAFHSRLMAGAANALRGVLAAAEIRGPSIPVINNLTADYVTDPAAIREGLAAQVDHPVRWQETVERLAAANIDIYVEVGPGNVLAGMMRRAAPNATVLSVGTPDGVQACLTACR